MKQLLGLGLGLAIVVGCKSPRAAPGDAQDLDGAPDATVEVDAPPDVPPDVPPDAPSPSPRCLSGAVRLLDVSPRRIGMFARSGSTLYVSAYDQADPTGPGTLHTFDLTTNTQSAAPFVTPAVLFLASTDGDGDVFGADGLADGSVWRLHPGTAPTELIQHRLRPLVVTADATHVYWSERATLTGPPDQIVRRAIAGGAIEPVMTCPNPTSLHVIGTDLYCSEQGGVLRHHTDGSGATVGIAYPLGYPVFATMAEGADYYFAPHSFTQHVFRVDSTSTTGAAVANVSGLRMVSLSATADYFYTVDLGNSVRRVHRVTGVEEMVYPPVANHEIANQAALEWNDHLYFDAQDYNVGDLTYLMHCVD